MEFAHVVFSEDFSLNASGNTHNFEAGTAYQLPREKVDMLRASGAPIEASEGVYDVPGEEVADRFGAEAEEDILVEKEGDGEALSVHEEFLEDATNAAVADHVEDEEEVEYLETLLEAERNNRDRKGAKEAIEERIGELETESDGSEDAESESTEG